MIDPHGRSPAGSILAAVVAFVLALLCCAGPLVIAAGATAGVRALLRSPWLLGAGSLLLAWVIFSTVARVARRRDSDVTEQCCPPKTKDAIHSNHTASRNGQAPHAGRLGDRGDR